MRGRSSMRHPGQDTAGRPESFGVPARLGSGRARREGQGRGGHRGGGGHRAGHGPGLRRRGHEARAGRPRPRPLDDAVGELRGGGAEAVGVRTDVSKLEQVEALAADRARRASAPSTCSATTPASASPRRSQHRSSRLGWIIDVDLWGPIYGVKVFLPIMESRARATSTPPRRWPASSPAGSSAPTTWPSTASWRSWRPSSATCASQEPRCTPRCSAPARSTPTSVRTRAHVPAEPRAKPRRRRARSSGRMRPTRLAHGHGPRRGRASWCSTPSQNDRFWVLTHPDMARYVERQVEAMVTDRSLPRA